MKKEITNKDLLNFKKDFDASNLNKLASNSVMRNGVKNSAYNSYIKRELVNQFSIEVKNTGSITNQKQSGRCWIFAGLNVLRGIAMKNLHVKNIEFSESYLMFYDKLEKSNYQLEAVLDNLDETDNSRLMDHIVSLGGQQDGGYWHYFVALVKKYGICPIQAMPETISSSSSSEMDSIISTLITKDTAILRNRYHKELSKGSSKQDAKEKVSKLKENMLEEIYRVLAICLGKPCEEFTFEYQEDDPVKENEQEKKVKSKKESKEKSQFSLSLTYKGKTDGTIFTRRPIINIIAHFTNLFAEDVSIKLKVTGDNNQVIGTPEGMLYNDVTECIDISPSIEQCRQLICIDDEYQGSTVTITALDAETNATLSTLKLNFEND